jgi:tRNA(Ile)-lysidine synthase TilS/MesJ
MSDAKVTKPVRHLLGLSGGKDSSALAIYLRDRVPMYWQKKLFH